MRHCPECGSSSVVKDKKRGGWTGDYICEDCGCNNALNEFFSETEYKMRKKAGTLPNNETQ